ncbi:MAG: epoxyqueuosine reductase [Paraglaciecola psychrophila]
MTKDTDDTEQPIIVGESNLGADDIRRWGLALGFQDVGICDIDLTPHRAHLKHWLERNFHGDMDYMARHGDMRGRPEQLLPGTVRVISARMDYLPDAEDMNSVLADSNKAYISRYALGRDYHKLMRKRLAKLSALITDKIAERGQQHQYRAFVDSAPVLERALAEKAGLGWIGKNAMLINAKAGSWFFLGEIYTDLPLAVDPPQPTTHCGSCTSCIDECPTGAIVGPNQVDARRCISYLTIELRDAIPEHLRPLIGNRIYGCDDCQLVCPWNKFASATGEADFQPRNNLGSAQLVELFNWSEQEFLQRTEGSAIRRIGYLCWLRNIAVALGNSSDVSSASAALHSRYHNPSEMVREHIHWALAQLKGREEQTIVMSYQP